MSSSHQQQHLRLVRYWVWLQDPRTAEEQPETYGFLSGHASASPESKKPVGLEIIN